MANRPSAEKAQWNCRVPRDVLAAARERADAAKAAEAAGEPHDVTAVVVWALREYGAGRITPPPPTRES